MRATGFAFTDRLAIHFRRSNLRAKILALANALITSARANDVTGDSRLERMNLQTLRSQVKAGKIDTVIVAFPDVFGRLMGKRFTGQYFIDSVADHGTHHARVGRRAPGSDHSRRSGRNGEAGHLHARLPAAAEIRDG